MSVYVARRGRGPDLVLLHGWGLHGGVWDGLAGHLEGRFHLHIPDLPGFGRSPPLHGTYSAEALAAAVAEAVPAGAAWLGWSLGGMVALAAAADGGVGKLVLTGTSPRFVRGADWADAVDPAVLAEFAHALAEDWESTLQRFLALQARGSERGREEIRALREGLLDHGAPTAAGLTGGLDILARADLRPRLSQVEVPALLLQGTRDTLVPPAAAEATVAALPHGRLVTLPGAGHAPFLSHPEPFLAALEPFLDE